MANGKLSLAFKVKDSKFIPSDSNQGLSLFKKLNKSNGAQVQMKYLVSLLWIVLIQYCTSYYFNYI